MTTSAPPVVRAMLTMTTSSNFVPLVSASPSIGEAVRPLNADEMSGLPAFADQAEFKTWSQQRQADYAANREAYFRANVREFREDAHPGRPL